MPSPAPDAPPVPDSVMVEVFIELYLLQARVEVLHEDETARRDSILLHYGLDRQTFEAQMTYYAEHPEVYMDVHTEALDKLSSERYETNSP